MSKLFLSLTLLSIASVFADNSTSSAPISSDQGLVNGVYKSTKSHTFIKIGDSTISGLTCPAVASRKGQSLKSASIPYAASFDERLYFKRVNPTTYVSTDPDSSCVATLKKVETDSFIFSVNSVDICFNQHSQFNIESAASDQTTIVSPFKDVIFKLDTDPIDNKYFQKF